MKKTRLFGLLAVLALMAGLLAACGGDEDETETTATETEAEVSTEPLTAEAYAEEVRIVLEPLGGNLQSLGESLSEAEEPQVLAEGLGEAQEELRGSVAQLEGITPPEEVEDVHEDLIAAIDGFADTLEETRQAAEDENVEELQAAALQLPADAQEFAAELQRIQQAAIDAGVPIGPETTNGTEGN